ncbi:MAG: hypothetical protein ACK4NX_00070 [Candidatus Paceibacteria bacterium]
MKTSYLFIFIIVLALVGVGIYLATKKQEEFFEPLLGASPLPTPTAKVSPLLENLPTQSPSPSSVTILMVPNGFSPSSITISKGTTVIFVNQDTRRRWPASAVHPTHEVCPGFDAIGGVAPGESYSYTFNFDPPKSCPFHDHLIPSLTGKITIQ